MIHAIHDGPVEYADFVSRHLKKTKVTFHDGTGVAERFHSAGRQTRITFVRLFLHEFLQGVRKVIYLDSDIVVRRDLTPLFAAGPNRSSVAAALDYPLLVMAEQKEFIYGPDTKWRTDDYIRDLVGLKDVNTYFNAGVLVIDLERYGASGAPDRALAFLDRKGASSIFNDQDALNVALEGDFEILDPRWNFIPDFAVLSSQKGVSAELNCILQLCHDDPWVVHFAGLKPWETKERPSHWDFIFWNGLFDLVRANASVISPHLTDLTQECDRLHDKIDRAQAARAELLKSRSQLALALWRAIRWKAGLGPEPG